jgi:hypothetical protein
MAFTFETDPFDDIARVRFEIGDMDSAAYIFEDEVITGLIAEKDDDWQQAAIAAVENIITQLLVPGFTADWLKVDATNAVKGYERLLGRMETKFGSSASTIAAGSKTLTRADDDLVVRRSSSGEYT